MKTQVNDIPEFLGLLTNYDEGTMPLGGALSVANLTEYFPSTIQRIPGLVNKGTISGAEGSIPFAFRIQFGSNPDQLVAIITDTSNNVKMWNKSAGAEITGPVLQNNEDGVLAKLWSSSFYLTNWYTANGVQVPQKINTSSTRINMPSTTYISTVPITGSITPDGSLTVTGVNTLFLTELVVGQSITVHGQTQVIVTLDSDTSLTTDAPFTDTSIDEAPQKQVNTLTPPPIATFIETYLGRLYMAVGTSVYYTDSLTEDVQADNRLNTDELPGIVTGLAINSPTSALSGIVGELIIMKQTGLIKMRGDPFDSSSFKDVVSAAVGSLSPHTFVNTPVGLVFLGLRGDKYSVYFLPLGSGGEPKDIGQPLWEVLNNQIDPLLNVQLTKAVYHDGKYKLFLNRNGKAVEVWCDVDAFARDMSSMGSYQSRGAKIVWHGIHTRGAGSAVAVTDDKNLNIFEVISGAGTYFIENTDRSKNYLDSKGAVLTAVLDMPLNVPPQGVWKTWDIAGFYTGKASNVTGNLLQADVYVEGTPKSSATRTVGDPTKSTGSYLRIPLTSISGVSVSSNFSARVKLTHSLNKQLEILHVQVQTLIDEGMKIRA